MRTSRPFLFSIPDYIGINVPSRPIEEIKKKPEVIRICPRQDHRKVRRGRNRGVFKGHIEGNYNHSIKVNLHLHLKEEPLEIEP